MSRGPGFVLGVLLLALPGCRAAFENAVRQQLVPDRFYARDLQRPLDEVERLLPTADATVQPDGVRRYCLEAEGEAGCVLAKAHGQSATRFFVDASRPAPTAVLRAALRALEPQSLAQLDALDDDELTQLALEKEARFEGRFTFVAGARTSAVVSFEPPSFSVGGQLGFRYWGSVFVLPGAALDVEALIRDGRVVPTAGLQARIELAVWSDEHARFWNLPRVSFLMALGPVIGFGAVPSLGGRGVIGLHLMKLGRFATPLFFELGFQVLEVDSRSSTGLRVALGLGF